MNGVAREPKIKQQLSIRVKRYVCKTSNQLDRLVILDMAIIDFIAIEKVFKFKPVMYQPLDLCSDR
jgi:hypothetical protein